MEHQLDPLAALQGASGKGGALGAAPRHHIIGPAAHDAADQAAVKQEPAAQGASWQEAAAQVAAWQEPGAQAAAGQQPSAQQPNAQQATGQEAATREVDALVQPPEPAVTQASAVAHDSFGDMPPPPTQATGEQNTDPFSSLASGEDRSASLASSLDDGPIGTGASALNDVPPPPASPEAPSAPLGHSNRSTSAFGPYGQDPGDAMPGHGSDLDPRAGDMSDFERFGQLGGAGSAALDQGDAARSDAPLFTSGLGDAPPPPPSFQDVAQADPGGMGGPGLGASAQSERAKEDIAWSGFNGVDERGAYEPDYDQEVTGEAGHGSTGIVAAEGARGPSRFVMLGGAAAAVVVVGIGAYAFSGGESGSVSTSSSTPLVKADPRPVKVQPSDPGGRQFPNQNRAILNDNARADAARVPGPKKVQTAVVGPNGELRFPRREPQRVASVGQTATAGSTAQRPREIIAMPGIAFDTGGVSVGEAFNNQAARASNTARAGGPTGGDAKANSNDRLAAGTRATAETAARQAAARARNEARTSGGGSALDIAAQAIALGDTTGNARQSAGNAGQSVNTRQSAATGGAAQPRRDVTAQAFSWETTAEAPAATGAQPTNAASATTRTANSAAFEPGNYVVQVSSRRSRESALRSFESIRQRFGELLQGRGPDIQEINLGAEKGLWYRVRIAPATSRRQANDLCESLKAAGLSSCLVRTAASS